MEYPEVGYLVREIRQWDDVWEKLDLLLLWISGSHKLASTIIQMQFFFEKWSIWNIVLCLHALHSELFYICPCSHCCFLGNQTYLGANNHFEFLAIFFWIASWKVKSLSKSRREMKEKRRLWLVHSLILLWWGEETYYSGHCSVEAWNEVHTIFGYICFVLIQRMCFSIHLPLRC